MALHLRDVPQNTITLQIGGSLDLNLRVPEPTPEGFTIITVQYGRFTATAKGDQMAYTLPAGMMCSVQVAYVDANGNPASVDGEVTWTSSNDAIATAVVDPSDSTLCSISAIGGIGDAQITATADADLGGGTRELVTLLDVHIIAGEAVAGTISPVGEAQPIGGA